MYDAAQLQVAEWLRALPHHSWDSETQPIAPSSGMCASLAGQLPRALGQSDHARRRHSACATRGRSAMRSHKGERRALWVAAVHSPAPAWNLVGAVEDLASLVLHARRGGLDVIDIEI